MRDRFALGIHIGHDRAASLVKNGKLIAHLAQERIDRIKHSHSPEIPYGAIDALLADQKVKISDIKCVGITYSHVDISRVEKILKEEFFERYNLTHTTGFYGISHHSAHAQSAFFTSGFKESLILVADGSGDFVGEKLESESVFWGTQDGVRLIDRRLQDSLFSYVTRKNFYIYPYMTDVDKTKQISIARKYEQITYMLGFGWGQAGKTMGLAPYGKPLLDIADIDVKEMNFDLTLQYLIKEIFELQQKSGKTFYRFINEQRANIAATIQYYTEKSTIGLIKFLTKEYDNRNVCLAGGLFLNCVLNHKILTKTNVHKLYTIPPAGDDGQSIGAAFAAYSIHYGKFPALVRNFNPFLGLNYDESVILKAIKNSNVSCQKLSQNKLIEKASSELLEGKIIGLMTGRSECGPRALTHRSIIASPLLPEMRDLLNEKVKFREMFRPYAPVVTKEKQFTFFDLKQHSPYMLLSANVRKRFRDKLPSITHVDGTARIQALSKRDNPFLHALLKNFENRSGFPVLINTSFNIANEPVVESPMDAINTFLRTKIDFLIIENYWIEKSADRNSIANMSIKNY